MQYTSHRLRAQERKVRKKFIWTIIYIIAGFLLAIYVGLPLLAKLAVGLSLIKGEEKQTTENITTSLLAPIIEPIPTATNSASVSIRGYADKNATIIVSNNGNEVTRIDTDDEGNFLFRNIRLSSGDNKISLVAEKNDQKSDSTSISINYKNEPPPLEITEPSEGQIIRDDNKIEIKGNTSPDVKVSINDRLVIVDTDGSFSFPLTLSEGENTFNIKAEDDAGNTNEMEFKVTFSP